MKIKELRTKVKMTQLELAITLGVDRSTVTKWENGAAYPRAEQLPTLARVLKCSIDDLYVKEA